MCKYLITGVLTLKLVISTLIKVIHQILKWKVNLSLIKSITFQIRLCAVTSTYEFCISTKAPELLNLQIFCISKQDSLLKSL